MSQADTDNDVPRLIETDVARETISKRKKGKAARLSYAVSEMVKAAGEAGMDITYDLVNQIIIGIIPAEWECSTTANYYN